MRQAGLDPASGQISVELAAVPTPELRALLAELDAFLAQHYPPEQRLGLPLDALFRPGLLMFLARLDGGPAGCGGVALLDGFAEVKRMYVRPAARGRGLADALLSRLEHAAREVGLTQMTLQTGSHQKAAIRFYQRAGFSPVEAFGAYRAMPGQALATSVFLGKRLAGEPPGPAVRALP